MSAQINLKIDPALKKQLDQVLDELGLSLSGITRAFYKQVVRDKRVDFSIQGEDGDTPTDLTGEQLEKHLIKAGYSKAYAKKDREAYEHMLEEDANGNLIEM